MRLIQRILGIKDNSEEQAKMIEDKINRIQEKVFAELAGLKNENAALKSELSQKNNRITELLSKCRDQNEADLLLECKRIEKRVIEGEKRKEIDALPLNALQNMQTVYSQQLANQQNRGLSNYLGGAAGFL